MTRVVLSKLDVQRLQQALQLAVDYTHTMIDAYRVQPVLRHGLVEKIVPPEYRNDVDRWKTDIAAFQRLSRKLKNGVTE